MTDRRERIPAAEITDPKRWNLPYWTTPPHVIQAEREEKAKALAKAKAEQALAEIGDEEIEIEVQPYTAEQLENIRQQAYNEGLEQGLIEGRQKGETLGHEAGYQEGLNKGLEEGKKNGEEQGRQAIEQKLKSIHIQQAQEHAQQVSAILKGMQNFLSKQSKNIEKVLPELVEKLAQAVVGEELNQGSEHIVSLVKLAMDSLPLSSDHLHIELNEADVPYLEAAFENADFSAKIHVNKQISAGGCKIKTQHSQINFTLDERWQRIVQQYHEQLSLASLSEGDDEMLDPKQELLEPEVKAFSEETVTQLLDESSSSDDEQSIVEQNQREDLMAQPESDADLSDSATEASHEQALGADEINDGEEHALQDPLTQEPLSEKTTPASLATDADEHTQAPDETQQADPLTNETIREPIPAEQQVDLHTSDEQQDVLTPLSSDDTTDTEGLFVQSEPSLKTASSTDSAATSILDALTEAADFSEPQAQDIDDQTEHTSVINNDDAQTDEPTTQSLSQEQSRLNDTADEPADDDH